MERVPCRVTADLNKYLRELEEREPPAFDEYDDAMVKAVCGRNSRLAKPVQSLLVKLHQIEQTRKTFGVDHAKAFESVLPDLELLLEACRDEWSDL